MDLNLIQIFTLVAENQSFTKAAEKLNMDHLLKPIYKVLEEGNQSMKWINQYKEGLSVEDIMKDAIQVMIKNEEERI